MYYTKHVHINVAERKGETERKGGWKIVIKRRGVWIKELHVRGFFGGGRDTCV